MPLERIPEDDIKSLHGIDYSKYFELDIDFNKLTPKQLHIITNHLDISKKYFKLYLEKPHSINKDETKEKEAVRFRIKDETEEAVRLRSESMKVFRLITMKGGKRTKMKRKGKRTRRN